MKHYITLGLFLLTGLFSLDGAAQTVLLSENFSSITTGDNTTTGGSGTAWTGNSNFTVDANSKAYQAGGAVKLGTGSLPGYITTVPLDLSQAGGNFTLTFDVKGWTTVEGGIKVTVTGLVEQTVTYTAVIAGAFENKTINFTGGQANSTIRIETTAKRAFIDNVMVTTPDMSLDAPMANEASGVNFTEFTANWEPVSDASGYFIDVSLSADFGDFVNGYEDLAVSGTSKLVTGLTSNTVYYYRVRAANGGVFSEYSNVIDVATLCGPFTFPGVSGGQYCGDVTVEDLPVNEGYQWYATATGGTPLEDDAPIAEGTYYLTQTINGCESDRVEFEVTINDLDVPTVEDMVNVCPGGTVADLVPGGAGIRWYNQETGGTSLETTQIVSSGTYYVSQVEGECESDRVSTQVEVGLPDDPQGEAMQDFTEGQILADLDVVASNAIVWYADAGMATELPGTTQLVDGTTYYAANVNGDCMSGLVPFTVNMVLGLASNNMHGLEYYPNPVKDTFNLSYTAILDHIIVYNMVGQTIISNSPNAGVVSLDTSLLTAGTYFVKAVSGTRAKTIKIVKQ